MPNEIIASIDTSTEYARRQRRKANERRGLSLGRYQASSTTDNLVVHFHGSRLFCTSIFKLLWERWYGPQPSNSEMSVPQDQCRIPATQLTWEIETFARRPSVSSNLCWADRLILEERQAGCIQLTVNMLTTVQRILLASWVVHDFAEILGFWTVECITVPPLGLENQAVLLLS